MSASHGTVENSPSPGLGGVIRPALTALATGLLCNACCWLPPLAVAVGGATATGFAHAFEPWRPLFLAVAAVQLFFGFRTAYRPVGACCHRHHGDHAGHDPRVLRRVNIGVLWTVAVLVVVLNLLPTHH
ncbi:MAG: hypothetical protein KIS66_00675 [Fimbriimonadaceae bacterium]|nr:hypothetical protein [Fimbriimonadaceae bacterium]